MTREQGITRQQKLALGHFAHRLTVFQEEFSKRKGSPRLLKRMEERVKKLARRLRHDCGLRLEQFDAKMVNDAGSVTLAYNTNHSTPSWLLVALKITA